MGADSSPDFYSSDIEIRYKFLELRFVKFFYTKIQN